MEMSNINKQENFGEFAIIIFAGVVINLTIGENGLFKTAKYAVTKTEEEKAREKLELALADLQAHKYTNPDYDETDYINNYLSKESMIVIGDIVIVDGWKFSIDRSVPKIVESLGKGEENKKIAITTNVENASDYTKATIKIEIAYEGTIKEIKINGQEQEIPVKNEDEKYVITKEVTSNEKYTIYVKDENDEYKTGLVEVTEISEDMDIKTAQDLVYFRDRVNKGATYEGRTINVVNNIDLSKICYKVDGTIENDVSWIPIGTWNEEEGNNQSKVFKGTFNGSYNKIDYLYINTNKDIQGLFGYAENATITNLVIGENSTITGNADVGAILGYALNTTIQNCGNNAYIEGYLCVGGIIGEGESSTLIGNYNKKTIKGVQNVGGIVGRNSGTIEYSYNSIDVIGDNSVGGIMGCGNNIGIYKCYNTGEIKIKANNSLSAGRLGGIVGRLTASGTVDFCYNLGEIIDDSTVGVVGGIVGNNNSQNGVLEKSSKVTNSYNTADVTSNGSYVGGIVGNNTQYCYVKNCYLGGKYRNVSSGSTIATNPIGSASNYVGKIIGQAYTKDSTYVDDSTDYILEMNQMPEVYDVVNADKNGLNGRDSKYWSNTEYSNVELQTPKLKWESNIK